MCNKKPIIIIFKVEWNVVWCEGFEMHLFDFCFSGTQREGCDGSAAVAMGLRLALDDGILVGFCAVFDVTPLLVKVAKVWYGMAWYHVLWWEYMMGQRQQQQDGHFLPVTPLA